MYNYFDTIGDDLFKNLVLPAGIDRNTLIDNIMMKSADFEALYSNPLFVQSAIGTWSTKWQRTMQKWYDALQIQYDPLYNYDRTEEIENVRAEGENVKRNENAFAQDHSTSSGSGTTTNKVSAYDSSAFQNHDQADSNTSGNNLSDSLTSTDGETQRNRDEIESHKARMYGNIGVTTSQQMLQSELDIAEWNIYEHITDLFLEEFCIWIY